MSRTADDVVRAKTTRQRNRDVMIRTGNRAAGTRIGKGWMTVEEAQEESVM
jgi:hypothetical protein